VKLSQHSRQARQRIGINAQPTVKEKQKIDACLLLMMQEALRRACCANTQQPLQLGQASHSIVNRGPSRHNSVATHYKDSPVRAVLEREPLESAEARIASSRVSKGISGSTAVAYEDRCVQQALMQAMRPARDNNLPCDGSASSYRLSCGLGLCIQA
jgi:hypothetical protein